ncbi:MAG: hypothetical protein ACP5KE_09835 [Candidatus Methanodesulfokora sp.]
MIIPHLEHSSRYYSILTQGRIDLNINGTAKIKVLFFPVEVLQRRTIKP